MRRAARTGALAAALFSLTAGAAGAQIKTPTVVLSGATLYHSVDVPPNTIRTFTVTCPPGFVAMSGSASDADGSTPLRSAPAGARSWSFSFGQPVTATRPAHVTVLVICSKPKSALIGVSGKVKVKVKIGTAKSKPVAIPPGATEETELKCPSGSAPTGSGLDVAPVGSKSQRARARAAEVLRNGQVARETSDVPVRGGFRFAVRNPAAVPQTVRHFARCLARRARYRRRHRRRLLRALTRIYRMTFMDTAEPGSNLFQHSAPAGRFPVFAGYEYASPEDMIVLGHAFARPRRVLTPMINGEQQRHAFIQHYLLSPGGLSSLGAR
jgi:hypothetical protein